jgi:hypothetical protein
MPFIICSHELVQEASSSPLTLLFAVVMFLYCAVWKAIIFLYKQAVTPGGKVKQITDHVEKSA